MIRGFEIICEYLGVPPSSNVFFYLFTLTRPSGGGLTMGGLSFPAQLNRKIFLLYEESFHHFKLFYFKVFGAPDTIPFWEDLEGELRINYFWSKHIELPRTNDDELSQEERIVVDFLLLSFGSKHLNLKCVVRVDFTVAKAHLGCH